MLGAGIINPLNLRLAGQELQYILADSGTTVAFVDAVFADAGPPVLIRHKGCGGTVDERGSCETCGERQRGGEHHRVQRPDCRGMRGKGQRHRTVRRS